jgi:hypothetical protein
MLSPASNLLRRFSAFIALLLIFGFAATPAHAADATTTTLALTVAGSPVTSVAPGTVVTFTATVTAGGTPITTGQVTFCDADASHCTDIHILGVAQILPSGTATLKFIPPAGAHSYKVIATFGGAIYTSAAVPLAVTTSLIPTTTVVSSGGDTPTLTATITEKGGSKQPTGTVTFTDTSSSYLLGSVALASGTSTSQYPIAPTSNLNDLPVLLQAADFNNDGRPDILVSYTPGAQSTANGTTPSSVVQLTQLGAPYAPISKNNALPSGCNYVATADFNDDSNLDIATFISGASAPTLLTGNGDGTFSAPSFPAGAICSQILTGDFNLDGQADLAVLVGSQITLWNGAGDGTFTAGGSVSLLGTAPFIMKAGDFNGDGKPDLEATDAGTTVNVAFNHGDETFTATSVITPFFGLIVIAGDMNNDGNTDLVLFNSAAGTQGFMTLISKGDGTFTTIATPLPTGSVFNIGSAPIAGDINGDGKIDLIVGALADQADSGSTPDVAARAVLGNGDGTFSARINLSNAFVTVNASYVSTVSNLSIAAADIDGDGISDLIIGSRLTGFSRTGLPMLNQGVESFLLATPTISTAVSIAPPSIPSSTVNITASYTGDSVYASSHASTGTGGIP